MNLWLSERKSEGEGQTGSLGLSFKQINRTFWKNGALKGEKVHRTSFYSLTHDDYTGVIDAERTKDGNL